MRAALGNFEQAGRPLTPSTTSRETERVTCRAAGSARGRSTLDSEVDGGIRLSAAAADAGSAAEVFGVTGELNEAGRADLLEFSSLIRTLADQMTSLSDGSSVPNASDFPTLGIVQRAFVAQKEREPATKNDIGSLARQLLDLAARVDEFVESPTAIVARELADKSFDVSESVLLPLNRGGESASV